MASNVRNYINITIERVRWIEYSFITTLKNLIIWLHIATCRIRIHKLSTMNVLIKENQTMKWKSSEEFF